MNDVFPNRLKQLRLEKGMTQEEIAEQLSTRRSTYGEYERGKIMPPIDKIETIASILKTTPQYLLGWSEPSITSRIGDIIKSIRTKKHIPAEEFAEDVGINVSDLQKYEDNIKPIPMDILQVFAKHLNIPVESLVGTSAIFSNAGTIYVTENPEILKLHDRWYKEFGNTVFTIDEHDKIMEFAKFLLYQRGDSNK